ncbi:MAG: tRNA 2-selenouridine(34) synthase MnmH [Gammaproteobacteria bacterium]|nr:tRNA 2-selenouridine(34) synthase MnmH [Gammaproteobacteria bacterium]
MTPSDLLVNDVPLIDLRAPAEFARGAFPSAVNRPLLTDDERSEIGTLHKRHGRDAAIRRGHELVTGEVREARIKRWTDFLARQPDAWIYCWRGGLRSAVAQSWLRESGLCVPRVEGGYKQLRQACLDVFEALGPADAEASASAAASGAEPIHAKQWLVLAGRTGVGKTKVIERLPEAIDLEALARHRGSAFGGREGGQPTPIAFENALAIDALKHRGHRLIVEDESRTIGRLALPQFWHARMQQAPVVVLEAPLPARIARIRAEYVDEPLANGASEGTLLARHQAALDRIERRLGHRRHAEVADALKAGFRNGNHEGWIERLLMWYYDPMYDHQLKTKRRRIEFRGDRAQVSAYLRTGAARPCIGRHAT